MLLQAQPVVVSQARPPALGGLSPLASSRPLGGGPAVGQMTTATARWAGGGSAELLCGQGKEDRTGCVTETGLRGWAG